MKDFVRFTQSGTEMRFTCERTAEGFEVRLLRNGKKNSMAVQRKIKKAEDVFIFPNGEIAEMHIGMTALAITAQTAKDFRAWLAESIRTAKTEEELAAEAAEAKAAELRRIDGLLRRAGRQVTTPKTKKEAEKLTRQLREFEREEYGDWGGWARVISQEEIEELHARLVELRK